MDTPKSETGTSTTTSMMTHPYAELFPMLGGKELKELADDIKVNGQRDPIITYEGKILDGRGLYMACGMAGVEPRFEEWSGTGSLVRYVWSKNYIRRHLNSSQRAAAMMAYDAMLAKEAKERMSRGAKLTLPKGVANSPQPEINMPMDQTTTDPLTDEEKGRTREKLAEMANVSPRLMQDVKLVKKLSPEMFEQVKAGELTVNGAMKQIKEIRDPAASKRVNVVDPVSELVGGAQTLKRIALKVEGLTPDQARSAVGLAKAINTLGFVLTQLVPVLVRTGDETAIELVRKTIAALVMIPLDPQDPEPEGPSRKRSVRDDAAPTESGAENAEAAGPIATSAPCLDASKLEWPTGPGLKVVFPAQAMKAAVRRASLAALTREGQRDIQRVIGTTESCVKIAATDDGVTFESAIPRFNCRHVLTASDGAVVVEQGEVCVSAKQLKSICTKLAKDADTITVSFVPTLPGSDEPSPETSVGVEHHGAAEIGAVRGNAIVDKAPIASHQPNEFMSAEYDSTDAAKVIVAAKAAALRTVCRLAATAINPYDVNEILNKIAIFDGGDTVYFVGTDSRRIAVVPAKKSSFEKSSDFDEYDERSRTAVDGSTVMDKRPIPVLVDAEYLGPILAAAANDDSVTIATDEAGDYVYVSGGASCYRISRLDKELARKYPDYKKRLCLPMRAAILIDRQECRAALETLHQVNRDRLRFTFSRQDGTVTLSAPPESQESLNEGTSVLYYRQASEDMLKKETLCINTSHFRDAIERMAADQVKISFDMDEMKIRIEDAADPKLLYFMHVMNPSETV